MIKVGITSPMGGGKSYISSLFAERGVPVYNSDERARWVNNNVPDLKEKLNREFGDVYVNGVLDSFRIRKIVFVEGGEDRLKRLNEICHPYVKMDFEDFCIENSDKEYVLVESAILFESGFHSNMDRIIFVDAPYSVRIERVFKRDGILPQEYNIRMKKQMDENEKKRLSDYLIFNGEGYDCHSQVKKIHQILDNMGKRSYLCVTKGEKIPHPIGK